MSLLFSRASSMARFKVSATGVLPLACRGVGPCAPAGAPHIALNPAVRVALIRPQRIPCIVWLLPCVVFMLASLVLNAFRLDRVIREKTIRTAAIRWAGAATLDSRG